MSRPLQFGCAAWDRFEEVKDFTGDEPTYPVMPKERYEELREKVFGNGGIATFRKSTNAAAPTPQHDPNKAYWNGIFTAGADGEVIGKPVIKGRRYRITSFEPLDEPTMEQANAN